MEGLPLVKNIFSGYSEIFVLDYNGNIYALGVNNWADTWVKIKEFPPVEKILSGSRHTLIISNEGDVYSFGNNNYGQLGLDSYSLGREENPKK